MKDRFSYLDQMKDVEKAQRNSNIEMLRLISMFMILLLHANFIALGYPNTEQCCGAPVLTFTRMLMESLCIVSVNVFVLISGWFGIKFKWKNLGNIYFQCFFYGILALLFAIAVGEHVGLSMVIKQMYLGSQYWFVTSYVGLVLLSPFLNSIFTLHRQKVRVILLSLLAYVVLYGWLISDYIHISGGYTLLWFVVLYITAGYLRLSAENHTQSPKTYMGVYLMASFAGAMLAYLTARYQLPIEFSKFYNYNSPLVYIASIGLFLSFVKRPSGGVKIINSCATSCLAIYLVHCNELIFPHFLVICKEIFTKASHWSCGLLYLILLSVIIGICSIMIDKVRILVWNKITSIYYGRK